MKKYLLITIAVVLSSLLHAQNDITVRLGSTDASTLIPGDNVFIPIIVDTVSPGSYITGIQVDLVFDTTVMNWNGSNSNPSLGFSYVHPGFGPVTPFGNWMIAENIDGIIFTWIDPTFNGFPISSGETLLELVFTYQGGETPLSWDLQQSSLGLYNHTLINGCVCSPVANPVIFHVTSLSTNLENAIVVVENDSVFTNLSGNAVFYLLDGEYDYAVSKIGYETHTGSVNITGMQTIEIDLLPPGTFPVSFNCDVSCDNGFNGWNFIIAGDTLTSGQTIHLTTGDWAYSSSWLDCFPVYGNISVTAPLTIDCGFIGYNEPHVVFHVNSSQAGNIEGAMIEIDNYSLITDIQGEAGFCLPGGEYTYTISKEGYGTLTDMFSYDSYCQDTTLNILLNPLGIGDFQHNRFVISPNPGSGKFLVSHIPDGSLPVEIRVFDFTLKIIYSGFSEKSDDIEIDLSNQPKGMYFIQFQSGQKISSKKLIIQ
ncbi:MAG: T9SS type A sorting domain-containing protein [Bacteroidales bacterium]